MERDLIELPGEITKKISDEGDLKDKKDKDRFNSYLIAILNISLIGLFVYAARFLTEVSILSILFYSIVTLVNLYAFGRNR